MIMIEFDFHKFTKLNGLKIKFEFIDEWSINLVSAIIDRLISDSLTESDCLWIDKPKVCLQYTPN